MNKYYSVLLLFCAFLSSNARNLPLSNGPLTNTMCAGVPTTISNIVITEDNPNDFNVDGSGTIVFAATAGTFAMDGAETVQIEGSASLNATILVSSTKITITLTESSNDNDSELNTLTVSGIRFIAAPVNEENIYYSNESTVILNNLGESAPVSYILSSPPPTGYDDTMVACSEASLYYDLAGNVGESEILFSWVAVDNVNVTGESTSPQSGNYINDAIINESGVAQEVQYTVNLTNSQGCTGNSFTVTATVNLAPDLIIINNKPVISNGGTTNIQLSSNVGDVYFNFNGSGGPYVSGATEGSGNLIAQTLGNSVGPAQKVQYSIVAVSVSLGCSKNKFTSVNVNGFPSVLVSDSLALVALYNATGGVGWMNESGQWLSDEVGSWIGVNVTSNRVTGVDLSSNDVVGTLPAEIGDLTALTSLTIFGGKSGGLSGAIPSSIGNLINLTQLDLTKNALTNIPASISSLTKLETLDLSRNQISGNIPTALGSLTNLTSLSLNDNNFTGGLPANFNSLVMLETFSVANNDLALGSFPTQILAMTNLRVLNLSHSGITGVVPSAIQNLNLYELMLDNNAITGVPASLATLPNLSILYLNKNRISDLPDLSALSALTEGHVEDNRLTFEDIELNAGVPLFYAPQDSVGVKTTIVLQTSTAGILTSSVGGSANVYQWKKSNVPIEGATAATYTIASPDSPDEGTYSYEVTSPLVPGLTLVARPLRVIVSSLTRDSLALVEVYNATSGSTWKNKTGWLNGRLTTWNGVTVNNNRVTAINLPNNGLSGEIPPAINDIVDLKTVNVSLNKITALPLITLAQLTSLDVSNNKLGFGSLETNLPKLSVINYVNQEDVGIAKRDSLAAQSTTMVSVSTTGVNNTYVWKRDGQNVSGATLSSYTIASLDRSTMGEYICEINNTVVPGLTLKSAPHIVLAVSTLSGKLLIESTAVSKGTVTLFRIKPKDGYDTVQVVKVNANGDYTFNKVVLDDYQLMGFADASVNARALPTYYKKTILWEEADTLAVTGPMSNLDIVSELKPTINASATGIIKGIVEEEIADNGGRTQGKGRVSGAGVTARRVEGNGRAKDEAYVLVAYGFTNKNGEFELTNLPQGNYKLNIQYPGFPMDEKSFISFAVGTGNDSKIEVEALVANDKITVRQLTVTGLETWENYQAEIYPIPSREDIVVRFVSPSLSRTVDMVDVTGRKVLIRNAPEQQVALNVRALERGVYILTIRDKQDVVKKLRVVID